MIFVGLGANLPHPRLGRPRQALEAALLALAAMGPLIVRRSRWYLSTPVPVSDQPWFVNAVIAIATERSPARLLSDLHDVERQFGRQRVERDEARVLDLDLLAYDDEVCDDGAALLPHPRLTERAFVLLPLREVAPQWRHPLSGQCVGDLVAALPGHQIARPMLACD
jgi:2-amino-4-hydroxy-6-hydroxymethyldihydropteridine diphosphokinase